MQEIFSVDESRLPSQITASIGGLRKFALLYPRDENTVLTMPSVLICSAALSVRERATNIQKKGFWNRVFNSTKHRAGLASLEQTLENESKKFEVCHSHFLYYFVVSLLLTISYSLAPFCHSCTLTTGRTHEGIIVE